jgi:hypothetical protein
MSFYAAVQGQITYPNQERLDQVVTMLTEKEWMDNGKFTDECGGIIREETPSDVDGLTLNIPWACYLNLSRVLDEITKDTTGTLVWTSTDGCFDGGVYKDGVEKCYNLRAWASENMSPDDAQEPDFDNDFDNWIEWQALIVSEFHEEFAP